MTTKAYSAKLDGTIEYHAYVTKLVDGVLLRADELEEDFQVVLEDEDWKELIIELSIFEWEADKIPNEGV